jgi:hypothetical protein
MKISVFLDVIPYRYCVNRRFGGTYHHVSWLQPPAHVDSSLTDFNSMKMEAIRSSETSDYILSTRCHTPEDGILRKTNLKPKLRT